MNDVKKLTVLDFRKEQLVNLNDEEMISIKGGSSLPCAIGSAIVGSAIKITYDVGIDKSWWGDCPNGDDTEFIPSKYQIEDVTCLNMDWIYIYGI